MSGATGVPGATGAPDAGMRLRNEDGRTAQYWTAAGTVAGPLPKTETEALAEREQATVADPLPLGLAGFASATFTICAVYAHWFAIGNAVMAIPVALLFGGVGQFLAGMWAFRRGNALVATVFGTFGAFYASWALLEWMSLAKIVPSPAGGGNPSYVTGVFVLTFCVIAFYLFVAALGENLTLAAVLLALTVAYGFIGAGVMVGGSNWVLIVGGYAGLVSSVIAAYLSAAVVINSGLRRSVLPILPVMTAR